MTKTVMPSIKETAFSCPHCGAYTTQYWFELHAVQRPKEEPLIEIWSKAQRDAIDEKNHEIEPEEKEALIERIDEQLTGLVMIIPEQVIYTYNTVDNLYLSLCYNCGKIAVWVHDSLLFPGAKAGVQPNQDLPADIVRDFEEAREIVNASPRGAAALLRLCIQKLCVHLGETGKDLNEDIGSLVKKGLNPTIQKSLDIVRVIGNEAVHPGVLDLHDDRDTANQLFELVNTIADQMISHPKKVDELYRKLPEAKIKGIEKRNGKK
jgi:hypothetical protein